MDELRFVRREEQTLIVATEAGQEFQLMVDESILGELRHLSRRPHAGPRVRPREIQSLIRSGKTRAQVVEATGLSEEDIIRFEEPVLAERRYILELAQAVAVRTGNGEEGSEQFGTVISERLTSLNAEIPEWTAWRDEETGWMVSLEFISHGVAHRADWSFEHRKGLLAPVTPDAVNLSKQGEVGDRLIPKLRAVDTSDSPNKFNSSAFETANDDTAPISGLPEDPAVTSASDSPSQASSQGEVLDEEAEFARRREIDQRAISTPPELENDLGQTADLLDALRRRRGARENGISDDHSQPETLVSGVRGSLPSAQLQSAIADDTSAGSEESAESLEPGDASGEHVAEISHLAAPELEFPAGTDESETFAGAAAAARNAESGAAEGERSGRPKRRASIPSWDDILFGTRSEEDPAPER